MTPKEKAQDLFDKYFTQIRMPSDCEGCMQCLDRCESMVYIAKKYALILVDEMINLDYDTLEYYGNLNSKQYWQEVKQEIEAL
jgi:predicted aldo/keto reductase-like oxidoreductase